MTKKDLFKNTHFKVVPLTLGTSQEEKFIVIFIETSEVVVGKYFNYNTAVDVANAADVAYRRARRVAVKECLNALADISLL